MGGIFIDVKLDQGLIQNIIITFGGSIVCGVYLNASVIYYIACLPVCIIVGFGQEKQKKLKEKNDHKLALMSKSPSVMNHCMMLILAGIHPRNAIVESVRPLMNSHFFKPYVSQFINDLNSGIPLEGTILSFSSKIEYKPFCQMLQRVALYEKTGNAMILNQLENDLLVMTEQFNTVLMEQINHSDMKSMLPSLINLMILMIMMMAPILIGGVI